MSYQIKIVSERITCLSWIREFKSNEIMTLARNYKAIICQNNIMSHIRNRPNMKCSTPSIPGSNFVTNVQKNLT